MEGGGKHVESTTTDPADPADAEAANTTAKATANTTDQKKDTHMQRYVYFLAFTRTIWY
jgi:hypothetical protein